MRLEFCLYHKWADRLFAMWSSDGLSSDCSSNRAHKLTIDDNKLDFQRYVQLKLCVRDSATQQLLIDCLKK